MPQEAVPDALEEEEIEDELQMSGDEHIPATETVYVSREEVQNTTKAPVKVHEKDKLQRLIDDRVEKSFLDLFKEAHEEALTGTYIELFEQLSELPPNQYILEV